MNWAVQSAERNQILEQPELRALLDRFEKQLYAGNHPRIEEFTRTDSHHRLVLLEELVQIEIEHRCKQREAVGADDYLIRFPELAADAGCGTRLRATYDRCRADVDPGGAAGNKPLLDVRAADNPAPRESSPLPKSIGRYRIERVLGKGGFGIVYLAYDEQLMRPVAVKVPHAEFVSRPGDALAYLAEARTVASLDHPHIVPVYDVGGTREFPVYVVSKYVDGGDLAVAIAKSRKSCPETAQLIATIADAVHYAHAQGLFHRDLKPGNILLDQSGQPYVVDFGLALREQDVGKGSGYVGTPAYMSPEQARGEGHRIDGRSDIFSLGVMLYEMILGRRPFRGQNRYELLEQISTREAQPPRQIDGSVPRELERICLKALARRAADRYTTASDLAEDLRAWLASIRSENAASTNFSNRAREDTPAGVDVFVSYSSHDRDQVLPIVQRLRELGVSVWIDRDGIEPSSIWFKEIVDAIERCRLVMLIATAHSFGSKNVLRELSLGLKRDKPLVPLYLERVDVPPELEFILTGVQHVELHAGLSTEGLSEIVRALARHGIAVAGNAAVVEGPGTVIPAPVAAVANVDTPVPTTTPVTTPRSDSRPLKIVPKGLRSFDEHDADFFLELLPGPRDRDGLPDSIRFWKTRVEETAADKIFPVGLIFGPSGCGKSSLVKAGLLPRLSPRIVSVYAEASAAETEARLLNGLRHACPGLPAGLNLQESVTALRRGQGLAVGGKVLIVLDQFEQWLHATGDSENTELAQAIRQCDGAHVQCLLMVRDDFWMAASRFMRDVEVRLVDGHNSAAADLFPLRHAQRILTAFGRAFGALPDSPLGENSEQRQFIEQAVAELAEDGKVVCVRLALFAEMMKDKPWTPAELRSVGGAQGVGVAFLEETFSSAAAHPEHRYHQEAARGVLKALLPELGSDLKGHMRSSAELLAASGYANRPRDFDDLLRILDTEIRLITPTDPEGKDEGRRMKEGQAGRDATPDSSYIPQPSSVQHYQLAHDYLVPALRDWLTRKQRETRRGRAELLLAERAVLWHAKSENRHLPSFWEHFSIRWFTDKKVWTETERQMMLKVARLHRRIGLTSLVCLLCMTLAAAFLRANYLVESLIAADVQQVPGIIEKLGPYRPLVNPMLRAASEKFADDSRENLNICLALVRLDGSRLKHVRDAYRNSERRNAERTVAAEVLADFAANDVELLTDLIQEAQPEQFETLFRKLLLHEEAVTAILESAIGRQFTLEWRDDRPLDSMRGPVSAETSARIESAKGLLKERFAFCPRLTLAEFDSLTDELRRAGYRPSRLRPYAVNGNAPANEQKLVSIAAIWLRDGREFRTAHGLLREEIEPRDAEHRAAGLVAADVAAYPAPDGSTRFAIVWIKRQDDAETARLCPGVSAFEAGRAFKQGIELDLSALQQTFDSQGNVLLSFIQRSPGHASVATLEQTEQQYAERVNLGQIQFDLAVSQASAVPGNRQYYTQRLSEARLALAAAPDDLSALLVRGEAYGGLQQDQEAIEDFTAVLNRKAELKKADRTKPYQFRAISYARLGNKQAAADDVAAFENIQPGSFARYLDAVVAAWEGDNSGLDRLSESLKEHASEPDWLYNAACACAVASEAFAAKDEQRSHTLVREAAALLQNAVAAGFTDYATINRDYALESIRDTPEFKQVLAPGHMDLSYSAVWQTNLDTVSVELHGLNPSNHLIQCRKLSAAGFRPVSIAAVAQPAADGADDSVGSVWQRPRDDREKEQLTERQANASMALVRLGHPEKVWPLFRHSPDPLLRSMLIHQARPLRCDPATLIARFRVEADVSARRALLLLLGEFPLNQLSASEREKLIGELDEIFREHPDPGLHAAARWVLGQWGNERRLNEIEKPLMTGKVEGDRHWYVNRQGQTFSVITGPVDSEVGSPVTEAGRSDGPVEIRHSVRIERTFAICTTEVTVEQFRRFDLPEWFRERLSPTANHPINGVTWSEAAAYCNWLSEKEGIPPSEWCYDPDRLLEGKLKLPKNLLQRSGYRLPTEAEWEYACRAGAATSRYFGEAEALLPRYCWYGRNSQNRGMQVVGSLKPNDLGLFDMQGNACEWCQDRYVEHVAPIVDSESLVDAIIEEDIDPALPRVLRGAGFNDDPGKARSAYRFFVRLTDVPFTAFGFRVARTMPDSHAPDSRLNIELRP